jgi:hypothetical protein
MTDDLVLRLRKRAEIRRQIADRKSVQEGKPDRISDLLEEAAQALEKREWVGLTDEEVMQLAFNFDVPSLVIRTAEFKLKEKNT